MEAVLKPAFKELFPNAESFVGHDLLASARALLGYKSGFAAILGTGINSCSFDGTEIIHHIDSGAHILGDEGSGFYMGKRILIDFLRGAMPKELQQRFKEVYQLNLDLVHEAVYSKPLANRYCAGFTLVMRSISLIVLVLLVTCSEMFCRKLPKVGEWIQEPSLNRQWMV